MDTNEEDYILVKFKVFTSSDRGYCITQVTTKTFLDNYLQRVKLCDKKQIRKYGPFCTVLTTYEDEDGTIEEEILLPRKYTSILKALEVVHISEEVYKSILEIYPNGAINSFSIEDFYNEKFFTEDFESFKKEETVSNPTASGNSDGNDWFHIHSNHLSAIWDSSSRSYTINTGTSIR